MDVKLMQHQLDAIEFAVINQGIAAFHHEPGCGKTLSALATYSKLKEDEPDLKLLVICPISLIHGAWVKEIEKFTTYMYFDLHAGKSGKQKISPQIKFPDIYLVNFESLISVKKFNLIKDLLQAGSKWMCVIDESSKMKNHQGVITSRLVGDWDKKKFVPGIKQFCKHRIELTGTPAPNIEWEYFSQMKFLNDSILGDNFYKFRNKYFNLQRGCEIIPGAIFNKAALREAFNSGYKYEFDEDLRQDFFNQLKPWCHVVKAKDCLDLPETVDEYRMFDMDGEQARVYREMKTEYISEIKDGIKNRSIVDQQVIQIFQEVVHIMGEMCSDKSEPNSVSNFVVANIVLTKMMKLRQITSAFAIDEQKMARPIGTKNPKLNILLDLVEECGQEQMIIWCQFRYEIAIVVRALKEIGGVSELHGGIDEKDRIVHINKFIDGSNRFLVAHPDSAAHGLTFVNCRFATYFSLSYSYEEYEQSRKRIHRYGQTSNCVYFHILARHSVDEDVLAICQKKAARQDVAERFLKS